MQKHHEEHAVVQDAALLAEIDDLLYKCQNSIAAIIHINRLEGEERNEKCYEYFNSTPMGTILNVFSSLQEAPPAPILEAFKEAFVVQRDGLRKRRLRHLKDMQAHLDKLITQGDH